ncbi:SMP-30/gluconolactonase/LRE family protein [Vibrio atypicus]|uniref:SMP-30/gluconolactonase/LRE family protein n=1 Tax=Vibrio atypicus TaxID=558271 RepID=UPI001359BF40|nr:hypothetical protein [Vibrio atypicus]
MRNLALTITASVAISASAMAEPLLTQTIPNLPGAESIVFDSSKQTYFVSLQAGDKAGDGSVVALNKDFQFIATVASGLENPKGIAMNGDTLFVGDMEHLIEIDLSSGAVVKHEAKNAQFLNDVAIDDKGDVYVSDMFTSVIYKLSDNKVTTWIDSPKLENPNGLTFIDGQLYVAAWGYFNDGNPIEAPYGRVLKVDPTTKQISAITEKPLGNLDGIQVDNRDDLIVSDWKQGVVYSVSKQGQSRILLDLPRGAGDIYYSPNTYQLFVPMALEGEVLVFRNIIL